MGNLRPTVADPADVQHIAFTSGDIRATVAAMRPHGAEFLAIPDNYYDDLRARLGLDEARLAELKALGILYDRDEGGEFLQAYTRAHQRRFFFEIVERTGYAGYGAPNPGPARRAGADPPAGHGVTGTRR